MAKYTAIALNDGSFEVQKMGMIADKVSKIVAKPATGSDFWHPDTKVITKLVGAKVYDPMTVEYLLSQEQFETIFLPWIESEEAINGESTATHIIGKINTTLTGIRYAGHEYGDIDKTSNDPSKLIVTYTFEGTKSSSRRTSPGTNPSPVIV